MKLSPEKQQAAETSMTEMVGASIGIMLLAADDYEAVKANLHQAVDDFPAAMREILGPDARTVMLQESTRQVRWHSRELYHLLGDVAAAKAAEAGLTVEQWTEAALTVQAASTPIPE